MSAGDGPEKEVCVWREEEEILTGIGMEFVGETVAGPADGADLDSGRSEIRTLMSCPALPALWKRR